MFALVSKFLGLETFEILEIQKMVSEFLKGCDMWEASTQKL